MNRDEVMAEFCDIAGMVGAHWDWEHPADCICPVHRHRSNFQFSGLIMDFIRDAVSEKIARDAVSEKIAREVADVST